MRIDKILVTLMMFGIPTIIATKITVWNINSILLEIFTIGVCAICFKVYVLNNEEENEVGRIKK